MIHKDYNHSHGTYGYFDIGIIKLTEDKKYNTLFVQPICLPEKEENFVEGKAGVITGYAHQNKVRIGRFFHTIFVNFLSKNYSIIGEKRQKRPFCARVQ